MCDRRQRHGGPAAACAGMENPATSGAQVVGCRWEARCRRNGWFRLSGCEPKLGLRGGSPNPVIIEMSGCHPRRRSLKRALCRRFAKASMRC